MTTVVMCSYCPNGRIRGERFRVTRNLIKWAHFDFLPFNSRLCKKCEASYIKRDKSDHDKLLVEKLEDSGLESLKSLHLKELSKLEKEHLEQIEMLNHFVNSTTEINHQQRQQPNHEWGNDDMNYEQHGNGNNESVSDSEYGNSSPQQQPGGECGDGNSSESSPNNDEDNSAHHSLVGELDTTTTISFFDDDDEHSSPTSTTTLPRSKKMKYKYYTEDTDETYIQKKSNKKQKHK